MLNSNKAQRLLTDSPDCRFSFAFTDKQWRRRRSAGMNRRITVFTVTQLKVSLILKVWPSARRQAHLRRFWSLFRLEKSGAVSTGTGFGTETKKLLLCSSVWQNRVFTDLWTCIFMEHANNEGHLRSALAAAALVLPVPASTADVCKSKTPALTAPHSLGHMGQALGCLLSS